MGTWGPAIFSDDTACDVRDDYKDLLGGGLEGPAATDRLLADWATTLNDPDEGGVFWLALAATQWRLGRLEERVRANALDAIESGRDLRRWDEPKQRRKREAQLTKLARTLASPQPAPRRVPKMAPSRPALNVGDILELPRSERFGYVQFLGRHPDYGDTLFVLPGLFEGLALPDVEACLAREGYISWSPVHVAIKRGWARVIGNLPPRADVPSVLRRAGAIAPRSGRVVTWLIDGHGPPQLRWSLSEAELHLPIAQISDHEALMMDIEKKWRPEQEGVPDPEQDRAAREELQRAMKAAWGAAPPQGKGHR